MSVLIFLLAVRTFCIGFNCRASGRLKITASISIFCYIIWISKFSYKFTILIFLTLLLTSSIEVQTALPTFQGKSFGGLSIPTWTPRANVKHPLPPQLPTFLLRSPTPPGEAAKWRKACSSRQRILPKMAFRGCSWSRSHQNGIFSFACSTTRLCSRCTETAGLTLPLRSRTRCGKPLSDWFYWGPTWMSNHCFFLSFTACCIQASDFMRMQMLVMG